MNLKNFTTFGLFFLAVINLTAQTYKLKSKDISVSGTSTLHKWTSQITQASGQGLFQFEEGQLLPGSLLLSGGRRVCSAFRCTGCDHVSAVGAEER